MGDPLYFSTFLSAKKIIFQKGMLTFFLVIITHLCFCQKIALIDNYGKKPILFTDSISVEQVKSGYFPLQTKNIDTFYSNIEYIIGVLQIRQRAKMESFELRSGQSVIKVSRVPYAYGDRYTAVATNYLNSIIATMPLVNHKNSNKESIRSLEKLLFYLRNNETLFRSPYQITPKLYNIVVITE